MIVALPGLFSYLFFDTEYMPCVIPLNCMSCHTTKFDVTKMYFSKIKCVIAKYISLC